MPNISQPKQILSDGERDMLERCRKSFLKRPLGGAKFLVAYDLFFVVALVIMGLPGVLPAKPPVVTYLYLAACFVILLQSRYNRRLRAEMRCLSSIALKLAQE